MSFDFSTLVTNRSSSDVAYVRQLVERFVAGTATDADREAWNSIALKGAYNHTDLNRVNAAMSAINEMLVNAGYKPAYKKFSIPRLNYYDDVFLRADSVISGDDYDTYVFVAPGTGTFVCKAELDGVTKEQAVTVSENTQYPVDLAREQLVHYTMLYDSGDECTALTGGWERHGYNSGVFEKNADHIYATGVGNSKNTNGFCFLERRRKMAEIIVLAQKGAIVSVSGMDILIQNTNPTDAWIESDVPTVSQMQQYLSNVNALRSVLAEGVSAVVPSDMDGLTITEANSIEQVLSTINDLLVRMVTTFVPAGTATSGGDYL